MYPVAQVVGIFKGTQWPFPSDFYPSGQTAGGNSHTPLEFLKNPSAHDVTALSNTQFPFPSELYPLGQDSWVGGSFGSIGAQFPSPSDVYPLAHFSKALSTSVVLFWMQPPFPSVTNPVVQEYTAGAVGPYV